MASILRTDFGGLLLVIVICLTLSQCNLNQIPTNLADRLVRADSMGARINGTMQKFSYLRAAQGFIGSTVGGSSEKYQLAIFFARAAVDTYKWSSTTQAGRDTFPLLNEIPCIPKIGQLVILESDNKNLFWKGSFEFALIESARDTLYVKDGYFQIHYTLSD